MPLGFGSVGTLTTSDPGGGRPFTRLKGPLLLGGPGDSPGTSLVLTPPHIVNVSTVGADLITAATTFASTAGALVSTGSPRGLVYITMTSADIMAAGSTANAPVGLPGGATAAALLWDSAKKTIAIYDPLSSAWLWPHQLSTVAGAGGTIVWSASSS